MCSGRKVPGEPIIKFKKAIITRTKWNITEYNREYIIGVINLKGRNLLKGNESNWEIIIRSISNNASSLW